MSRDMLVTMRWDDLEVTVNAEGVSYTPDVFDDIGRNMLLWMHDLIVMAHHLGAPPSREDEDEEVGIDEE